MIAHTYLYALKCVPQLWYHAWYGIIRSRKFVSGANISFPAWNIFYHKNRLQFVCVCSAMVPIYNDGLKSGCSNTRKRPNLDGGQFGFQTTFSLWKLDGPNCPKFLKSSLKIWFPSGFRTICFQDFRHCPKSGHAVNLMQSSWLKSGLVWISDTHCNSK